VRVKQRGDMGIVSGISGYGSDTRYEIELSLGAEAESAGDGVSFEYPEAISCSLVEIEPEY